MDELFSQLEPPFLFLLKVVIIIFLLLYNVFSIIVVKQTKIMTEVLEVGFESYIKFIAILHFVFALGVLLLAIIIL